MNKPVAGNANMPILIVDDHPQYVKVLSTVLMNTFGYREVYSVESTEEAFSLISDDPDRFRLLFIDYNFPSGVSGGELLRKLGEKNLLEGKVVFLITADPSIEKVNEARKAGALGVVAKPFDTEALREQLEKAERAFIAESQSF